MRQSIVLGVVLMLALSACGSDDAVQTQPVDSDPPAVETQSVAAIGDAAESPEKRDAAPLVDATSDETAATDGAPRAQMPEDLAAYLESVEPVMAIARDARQLYDEVRAEFEADPSVVSDEDWDERFSTAHRDLFVTAQGYLSVTDETIPEFYIGVPDEAQALHATLHDLSEKRAEIGKDMLVVMGFGDLTPEFLDEIHVHVQETEPLADEAEAQLAELLERYERTE